MLAVLSVLALAASSATALTANFRMQPVVNSPCEDNVTQYAGYVDVDDQFNSHYFAWLSESRNEPSTDPLIVWLSGGPGCSSSLAMMTENGPCTAKDDGSGTTHNPFGWNTKANLMYVDQPAGVGFSYADKGGYAHNETQVGEFMVAFFKGFYAKYPQYAGSDLYMACESYGGHYCPSVTYALYESNQRDGTNFPIKGMAIGNGLVDPAHQYPTYPEFVEDQCKKEVGHACVDQAGYESMKQASPQCSAMIAQCQEDVSACAEAQGFCNNAMFGPYENTGMNPYDIRIKCAVPPLCYDFSGVARLLNAPATQRAIGVDGITWASCNYDVNGDFSSDWMRNMAWKVPPLLKAGIKAWVYAGVDDFIVQWLGNQAWTQALVWPGQAQYNATTPVSWSVGGKVAGTHRAYGGLSFTTVDNAGHMAPRDQPAATLAMINAFISGKPLPTDA